MTNNTLISYLMPVGAILLTGIGLSACSVKKAYQEEAFASASRNVLTRSFKADCPKLLQASRNVLLAEGFRMINMKEDQLILDMAKDRQVDDDVTSRIDFQVNGMSCGKALSTLGVSATETQTKSAEKQNYTDLSIGPIVSVPIPAGSEQSMSKTLGETVLDKTFYENFFNALEKEVALSPPGEQPNYTGLSAPDASANQAGKEADLSLQTPKADNPVAVKSPLNNSQPDLQAAPNALQPSQSGGPRAIKNLPPF
jgi:hypothetical protein